MFFFDHESIFFTLWGYPLSYLEFFGTLAGGIAVWLSARGNIWSWSIGIINVVMFFFLFYQVQLYPDMFLQVFFFITNLVGWWRWAHPKPGEENRRRELRASWMGLPRTAAMLLVTVVATAAFGSFASSLHELMPVIFPRPSAFPYADSFVLTISIAATYLMVQKKVECWAAWILADVVATYLYFSKGILFVGIEYFVFCLIAAYGLWQWRREAKQSRVRLICLYGPESTGKSTLARRLAERYHTSYVPEVAREMISSNRFTGDDIVRIAREQTSRVMKMAKTANRVLFCDTDVITTAIYSDNYLSMVPGELSELEKEVRYDQYFLFNIDVPWVDDGLRDLGGKREEIFARFKAELDRRNIPYILVSGSYEARERVIVDYVDNLLKQA
jgi:nicotinamide mononucleotide transporter